MRVPAYMFGRFRDALMRAKVRGAKIELPTTAVVSQPQVKAPVRVTLKKAKAK